MARAWRHEVSVPWLQARRDVLTASEIKAMLPEYKRMLKKPEGELSLGFFALCGEKLSNDIPDPESTGAAARGHILEPYAVDDWNQNFPKDKYHHWDDIVIKRNGLGYSPDGLDIPQLIEMGVQLSWSEKNHCLKRQNETYKPPTRAIEVKCYEPKNHMKGLIIPKEDRDERLQIAVAFMVLPSIEYVDVLWYCPEAYLPMYKERYTRDELKAEIKVITDMVKLFHQHMDKIRSLEANSMKPHYTSDEIYREYINEQAARFMKI